MGAFDDGFNTTGLPTAKAGAILCATRFRGKLKGVIAAIGPSREPPYEGKPVLRLHIEVQREHGSFDANRLLSSYPEGKYGTVDFSQGEGYRLARLCCNHVRTFLSALPDAVSNACEDIRTLHTRKAASLFECTNGPVDRLSNILWSRLEHISRGSAIKRIPNAPDLS